MMNYDVWTLEVTDRQTFIQFVEKLRADLLTNPDGWENNQLDRFLEALGSYAKDIQGVYDNTGQDVKADEPSWQNFANLLKGAAIYE